MQDFLFKPFCCFLKKQLEDAQLNVGHKVPNYFSSQKDVIEFLSGFERYPQHKIIHFLENVESNMPLTMNRPHLFTTLFLDYLLKSGNIFLAKNLFLQELHFCISILSLIHI